MALKRALIIAVLTFLVIMMLTAYAAVHAKLALQWRQNSQQMRLDNEVAQALRREFIVHMQVVRALQALYTASVSVEEDEFAAFTNDIGQGAPDVVACFWIPEVGSSEEHKPPQETAGPYWVPLTLAPDGRTEVPVDRRFGLQLALDESAVLGSAGGITVRAGRGGGTVFLAYSAIARSRGDNKVPPQVGVVGALVDLEQTLSLALSALGWRDLALKLRVGTHELEAGGVSEASHWRHLRIGLAGMPVELSYATRERQGQESVVVWWVWSFGTACAAISSAYIYLLTGQNERIRHLVAERTAELERANEQLKREIEERRKIEHALREAQRRAELANTAKSEFISRVSHEIRTPIQTITAVVDMLARSDLGQRDRASIRMLQHAAQALLDLVENILDYARVEAGKIEVVPGVVPVRQRIGEWVRLLAVRAREKGLEVLVDIGPEVPEIVEVDESILRQIINNLVSNAVKYTEEGHVFVRVSASEGDGRGEVLKISVEDTGPGIPGDMLPRIFEPFVRLHTESSSKTPGTGLGLTIVKRSIEAIGGRIEARNRSPRGLVFEVEVPCRFLACSRWAQAPAWSERAGNVLLISQCPLWFELLRSWFDRWGYRVLADWILPDEEIDVAVAETEGPPLESEKVRSVLDHVLVPAVILIDPLVPCPDLCRPGGTALCLTKPVTPDELAVAIGTILQAPRDKVAQPDTSQERAGGKILVVEDSVVNRTLVETLLNQCGYRVRAVGCASDALAAFEEDQFDVVLVDVELPDGDGFEVARRMRRLEAEAGRRPCRIIAITGHSESSYRARACSAGIDRFLAKPVPPVLLLDAIRGARSEERQGRADECSRTGHMPDRPLPELKYVSLEAAAVNVGGDWGLYQRVLKTCAAELPQLITTVDGAIRSKDADSARVAVHTVRGALRTVGAVGLLEELRDAELAAAAGDFDRFSAQWDALRPRLEELLTHDFPLLEQLTQDDVAGFTRNLRKRLA